MHFVESNLIQTKLCGCPHGVHMGMKPPTPEQVSRLTAPPLTKDDVILRIENAHRALSVVRKALGDITLDAMDGYDLEALRDIHHASGMMAEELGTLLDVLQEAPTPNNPFADLIKKIKSDGDDDISI